ncbi:MULTISPECIES: YdiY family protein [unclassified Salinivibrio]|uniref:DUF481 domain-containing protein n=1 Tax=unclassified Salinivibrio TaxID=2636825 RepID=UPI00098AD3D7|nr:MULTISPECIES: DUF481 domain-containing protein [unclassified Salinivibrio]OOF10750.1 hypothetical protein BZG82_06700 [Salinivibrio sp. PR5]PCE68220.1 hypothetical protein B6G00_07900 [Salinivibrio sp. YCSC6]QCF34891.1 DUF481 domain-containing protein [Salinivibrio sp. YCSC6]
MKSVYTPLWISLCVACISPAYATEQDDTPRSPWSSDISIGYQRLGGNADSQTINSELNGQYQIEQYSYQASVSLLQVEKDGEEDKRKTEFESQANMKLSAQSYALLNATYVADRYGPYFDDFMLATGLGYQWIERDALSVSTEIGPGFRYQRPNLDEIDDDDLIMPYSVSEPVVRAQAKWQWRFLDNASIEGRTQVVSGESNTSVEGVLSLATTITEKLSIKLTGKQNYMSEVPPGLKHKDSVFTVGLRYQWL